MMSERASVLPGNRRLNSKARAKPMMNWPRRDPKVNSSVWTIAVRLVGSLKDEAVVVEPGERRGEIGDRRGRRLLEAQHHVVDDGQGEREEQVRDRRGQEEPARELLPPPSRQPSRRAGAYGRRAACAGSCWCRRRSARLGLHLRLGRSSRHHSWPVLRWRLAGAARVTSERAGRSDRVSGLGVEEVEPVGRRRRARSGRRRATRTRGSTRATPSAADAPAISPDARSPPDLPSTRRLCSGPSSRPSRNGRATRCRGPRRARRCAASVVSRPRSCPRPRSGARAGSRPRACEPSPATRPGRRCPRSAGRASRCDPSESTSPSAGPEIAPSYRFIGGEPMNEATNRFAGLS